MFGLIAGVAGAAVSALSGRSAQKKQQRHADRQVAEMNEYNDPVQIRERAEKAGFNPLAFVGPGVGNQTQTAGVVSGNPMGDAFANIGMMIADHSAQRAQQAADQEKLRTENAELIQELQRQTIRPMVDGIFSIAGREGGGRMVPSGSGLPPVTVAPPGYSLASDERVHAITGGYGREIEHSPVTTGAGLTVIDNSMLSGPMSIPGDDGEPWGIDELATAVVIGGPQLGYHWLKNRADNQGTRSEKWRKEHGIGMPERFPSMTPWSGY